VIGVGLKAVQGYRRLFPRPKPLIGMIPLPPLPGCPDHPGMDAVIGAALADLAALESAGFDAVLIENDNDQPHAIGVSAEIREAFAVVAGRVVDRARMPVGMEILYDMEATVAVARQVGAAFARLDVFVDAVETRWGVVPASAAAITAHRRDPDARDPLLLTDLHVKHARLLAARSLRESAIESVARGSAGLIVTGDWTGRPPSLADLRTAKEAAGDTPVVIGSGLTVANAPALLRVADAAIVGTSLKTGGRMDREQAAALAAAVEALRASP
jgi:membrane complex biogenesis BtpA family protein